MIKQLIKQDLAKGLKQIEISKKIGVTQPALYKYLETETEPTLTTLKKFSRAYNITINELTGNVVSETPVIYSSQRQCKLLNIEKQLNDKELEDVINYAGYILEKKKQSKKAQQPKIKKSEPVDTLFIKLKGIEEELSEATYYKDKDMLKAARKRIIKQIEKTTGVPLQKTTRKTG